MVAHYHQKPKIQKSYILFICTGLRSSNNSVFKQISSDTIKDACCIPSDRYSDISTFFMVVRAVTDQEESESSGYKNKQKKTPTVCTILIFLVYHDNV